MQIVTGQGSCTASLHLLKIVLAPHVPHEDQALNGLDVGSRGDHIHGDGDTGVVIVTERAEHALGVLGGIGDLFAELVPFSKLLPHDLDDIVGVAVGLGEDQGLGHLTATGEQGGKQILLERAYHGTDLTGIDNVPIQLCGHVVQILVHLPPPLLTGGSAAHLDHLFHDMGAVLPHVGFNQENILSYVDTVNDGLFARILADYVLMEESKGTLVGCGGQADDKGIKILQNLAPHVVDGAVTLVDDDAVEEFGRVLGIIYNFLGGFGISGNVFVEGGLLGGIVQLLAFEDGVHSLDGADADLYALGNIGGLESVDTVDLREGSGIVGGSVC